MRSVTLYGVSTVVLQFKSIVLLVLWLCIDQFLNCFTEV